MQVGRKSEKERKAGIIEGRYTKDEVDTRLGVGSWRPMRRFAIWQHDKWRIIDDAREGGQNSTVSSGERIHTTRSTLGFAAAKRLRQITGAPLTGEFSVQQSVHDMEDAYRQLPVADDQVRWAVVTVWCPTGSRWLFGLLRALAFGEYAAVLYFNRLPSLLCALGRRWLAVPVIAFYDDFKVIDIGNGKCR